MSDYYPVIRESSKPSYTGRYVPPIIESDFYKIL